MSCNARDSHPCNVRNNMAGQAPLSFIPGRVGTCSRQRPTDAPAGAHDRPVGAAGTVAPPLPHLAPPVDCHMLVGASGAEFRTRGGGHPRGSMERVSGWSGRHPASVSGFKNPLGRQIWLIRSQKNSENFHHKVKRTDVTLPGPTCQKSF